MEKYGLTGIPVTTSGANLRARNVMRKQGMIILGHGTQKTNGNIAEKLKGNANEKKSIYYENQVRQKEGEPARSYDYYKANKEE